ncbi:MAG TPA: hypothetical protein VNY75_05025 [Rhizomicrobium sp.]|nr:hypothetical protein [Rhizomicrobium sp.]
MGDNHIGGLDGEIMRNFCAALVATSLMIVPMASADPLAPGKPAGVRTAQREDITPLIYFGVVAVGIGIALAVAGNNNNTVAGSTVTAPPTTTS